MNSLFSARLLNRSVVGALGLSVGAIIGIGEKPAQSQTYGRCGHDPFDKTSTVRTRLLLVQYTQRCRIPVFSSC